MKVDARRHPAPWSPVEGGMESTGGGGNESSTLGQISKLIPQRVTENDLLKLGGSGQVLIICCVDTLLERFLSGLFDPHQTSLGGGGVLSVVRIPSNND